MAPKDDKIVASQQPFPVFSMEADLDYVLARLIAFIGGRFGARAGFFAHGACEKYLKALSVQLDGTYIQTHKLVDLAAACTGYDAYFSHRDTLRILEQFDMFDQVGRYGAAANFDPLSKSRVTSSGGMTVRIDPGIDVAGAWVWTPRFLQDLDGFVFKARSYLDFAKIEWGDGLKGALAGDARSSLTGEWHFPIPLVDVITHQNAYFKAPSPAPQPPPVPSQPPSQ
jgi:HEPN domain